MDFFTTHQVHVQVPLAPHANLSNYCNSKLYIVSKKLEFDRAELIAVERIY